MSSDGWAVILILVLVILCAGDPDVLDGIVHLMMKAK